MKFILAENIKNVLDERLYLTEDLNYNSFISQCKTLLDYIKKLLKNNGNKSNSDKSLELKIKKAADKIVIKTNDLVNTLKNVEDIDVAGGRFNDYRSSVEDLFKIIDPNYGSNDSKIFKLFKDIDENILSDDADFTLTKKALIKSLQSIVPITTELSKGLSIINDADTSEKYDEEKQHKILQSTYADIYRLAQLKENKYDATVATIFSPIIELLAKKMTEAEADKSKVINFLRTCEAAENEKTGSLKIAIQKNNKLFTGVDSKDIVNSFDDGQDWGTRYDEAVDKAEVWQAYLKAVWKDHAEDINKLGEPFRQECEKLGFNGASNPFIAFLEEYLVKKQYPIDRAHYFAIHNAVVNGDLKRTDLVNPKEPVTKANNIIFWEDFYLKGNAAGYLELFGNLRNDAFNFDNLKKVVVDETPDANKKLFFAISKWLEDTSKTKADFIYVIMSATNSLNDLLNVDGYIIKSPTAQLRPIAEITQLLNALDIDVTKKKSFSNSNVDTLIAAIDEQKTPFIGDSKAWAQKIIKRLADAAGSDSASIRAYDALVSMYPKVKTTSYSWEDGQKILGVVSEIGGDVDWAMINKIAKKFKDKGWFD